MKQRIFTFVLAGLLLLPGCSSTPSSGGASSSVTSTVSSVPVSPETPNVSGNSFAPEVSDASTPQNEGGLTITVNGTALTATLADNSSAQALRELLAEGPLTIEMSDYGNFEKVGSLGTDLPRNDEQITT